MAIHGCLCIFVFYKGIITLAVVLLLLIVIVAIIVALIILKRKRSCYTCRGEIKVVHVTCSCHFS